MQHRDSLFDWAIPGGTWSGTRVRFSPLLLVVPAALMVERRDVRLGAATGLCFLAAAVLHELAHLAACRWVGRREPDAHLWPLGRMSRPNAAGGRAAVAATLAGPLTNLALALICLVPLAPSFPDGQLLNPLRLPAADFSGEPGIALIALFFFANWTVFLANLLPAPPLAGGRLLAGALASRLGPNLGVQAAHRLGLLVGVTVVLTALLVDGLWLCALGAFLCLWNLKETSRQQVAETFDESFMGYDFSQGYTSLEKTPVVEADAPPGLLARWLARRRAQREQRQREKDEQVDRQLDALLDKVHAHGIDSLTDAERRMLKRASQRYRGRSKS